MVVIRTQNAVQLTSVCCHNVVVMLSDGKSVVCIVMPLYSGLSCVLRKIVVMRFKYNAQPTRQSLMLLHQAVSACFSLILDAMQHMAVLGFCVHLD